MSQEISELAAEEQQTTEAAGAFPFPFNQHTFCRYEPIEKRIEAARVLIVDNLLRDEDDLSDIGRAEWGNSAAIATKARTSDRRDGVGKYFQQHRPACEVSDH